MSENKPAPVTQTERLEKAIADLRAEFDRIDRECDEMAKGRFVPPPNTAIRLRATDAAAHAPVARPLTDEEIEAGRHETFSTSNPFCPCTDKTMRKAVRWAERACAKAWGVKLVDGTGQEDNNGKVPRL